MKTFEANLFEGLTLGQKLLDSLTLTKIQRQVAFGGLQADAVVEIKASAYPQPFRFVVEAKLRSSPAVLREAMLQAKHLAANLPDALPMVLVPYLSRENILELLKERVAGLDLCGNGIVSIPTAPLFISHHSGAPNPYPDGRSIGNPYAGKSALVGRWLLTHGQSASLSELQAGIRAEGGDISLGLASKVVDALADELLVFKDGRRILLREPARLLTRLGEAWRKPEIRAKHYLRLPKEPGIAKLLAGDPALKWAVTGESSAGHHHLLAQGGPVQVAVSSLERAAAKLNGTLEHIRNFADVELLETDDPAFYFGVQTDDQGARWATPLQTWLELQAGDARQRDAARDLRLDILKGVPNA